jgi:ABC-type multidrug transport system ATPase subunit
VGANLNGSEGDALRKAAVASAVADVGLSEKRYYRAAALSGGQKRKLCLAMALIGDPKVMEYHDHKIYVEEE